VICSAREKIAQMTAGVYLHIPFCKSRCSYCDFATDVYRDSGGVERYVDALCQEVSGFSTAAPPDAGATPHKQVGELFADSVYFGGGTPSLLSPDQVSRILNAVRQSVTVSPDAEITMEMNPATVTPETLAAYRELGINRASFGVQTFNDRDLKLLARGHDANDARNTFRMLREAGFHNVSFDLIAGLPGQTMQDWQTNLGEAIKLDPEHISLYLLEIHSGTPLAEQVNSGRRPPPDDALAAEMYEIMLDRLAESGYAQYEISNFAKPGFESRHNTKYWRLDPVYGFGVSAHSFDGRQRYSNDRDTAKYVDCISREGSAVVMREDIDLASEFVFLGLRLESGIDLSEYRERFGRDLIGEFGSQLDELTIAGLVESPSDHLRLTRKGKLFSNEVFSVFV
jgi:oxygen-independent coproporphyrinogen-3 oxidase